MILEIATKYPNVECLDIQKVYGESSLESYAYREYTAYYEPVGNAKKRPF